MTLMTLGPLRAMRRPNRGRTAGHRAGICRYLPRVRRDGALFSRLPNTSTEVVAPGKCANHQRVSLRDGGIMVVIG